MVQSAYDLHHINVSPTWALNRQLVALNILPPDPAQGDDEKELSVSDVKVGASSRCESCGHCKRRPWWSIQFTYLESNFVYAVLFTCVCP